MKCPICGFDNNENSNFCNQCGNPMSYEPDEKTNFRDSTIPMRPVTEEDLENAQIHNDDIEGENIKDNTKESISEENKVSENQDELQEEETDEYREEYYEDEDLEKDYIEDAYEDDEEVEILNTNSSNSLRANGRFKELLTKRTSIIIGVAGISIVLILLVAAFSSAFGLPINKFKRAFDAGRYDEAIEIYNDVKDKDSWEDIKKSFSDYLNSEAEDLINDYTKDKINSEKAEEKLGYMKAFGGVIDFNKINSNYETLKADKENYKLAKQFIDKNEYIEAMKALRSISDKSKDKNKRDELISSIEYKYKDELMNKTNELAKENKYDEALDLLNDAEQYYKLDGDISKQKYDINKQKEEYDKKNKQVKEEEKNSLMGFFNEIIDKATGEKTYKPTEYKNKFSIPFRGVSIMPYIDGDVGNNTLRFMVGINTFREFNMNKIVAVTDKGEEEITFNINSRQTEGKFLGKDEWIDIPISKSDAKSYNNIKILEDLANSNNAAIKVKGKSDEEEYKLTAKDKENILNCIKLHNM